MPKESTNNNSKMETIQPTLLEGSIVPSIIEEVDPISEVGRLETNTVALSQKLTNIFPKTLESSGYIILSTVALLFCIFFALFIIYIQKAITTSQHNIESLKEVMLSLFISQQNTEYKMLLDEFNRASDPTDKLNTKTQLWNFLNKISREICETKNDSLANQLGTAFFSKIHGRYLKMGTAPDGVIYFKAVGDLLIKFSEKYNDIALVKKIRSEYRRNIVAHQQLIKETEQQPITKKINKK